MLGLPSHSLTTMFTFTIILFYTLPKVRQRWFSIQKQSSGSILSKKVFLKSFQNSQENNLWQSLFFNTVAGLCPLHFGEKKVCERKETVL